MQALWLANMSSVILFWPYLKASFMTPIKQFLGQTMEFKTTLKGANVRDFSFKVYGMPIFILAVNIVTFIIGITNLDTQINAAMVRPPPLRRRRRRPDPSDSAQPADAAVRLICAGA